MEKEGRRISQAVHAMKRRAGRREESETVGLIKLLIDEDSGLFWAPRCWASKPTRSFNPLGW